MRKLQPTTEQPAPKSDASPVPRSALSPAEFAASFGFTAWWFHQLKGELKPRTIVIRGRNLVIETPAAYIERVAALQASGTADDAKRRRAQENGHKSAAARASRSKDERIAA